MSKSLPASLQELLIKTSHLWRTYGSEHPEFYLLVSESKSSKKQKGFEALNLSFGHPGTQWIRDVSTQVFTRLSSMIPYLGCAHLFKQLQGFAIGLLKLPKLGPAKLYICLCLLQDRKCHRSSPHCTIHADIEISLPGADKIAQSLMILLELPFVVGCLETWHPHLALLLVSKCIGSHIMTSKPAAWYVLTALGNTRYIGLVNNSIKHTKLRSEIPVELALSAWACSQLRQHPSPRQQQMPEVAFDRESIFQGQPAMVIKMYFTPTVWTRKPPAVGPRDGPRREPNVTKPMGPQASGRLAPNPASNALLWKEKEKENS